MKSACVNHIGQCPICRGVLKLRSWEALVREESRGPIDIRRCPDCGFCYGKRAPDCFEAGEVERLAQLGVTDL